jgi:hypothetical protein
VVEGLPSKYEGLSSKPNTEKRKEKKKMKEKKVMHTYF